MVLVSTMLVGAMVSTPKGLLVSFFSFLISVSSSSDVRLIAPRMPRPPASDTAAASSALAAPPMPASRMGYSMSSRSHRLVRSILRDIGDPPSCLPCVASLRILAARWQCVNLRQHKRLHYGGRLAHQ